MKNLVLGVAALGMVFGIVGVVDAADRPSVANVGLNMRGTVNTGLQTVDITVDLENMSGVNGDDMQIDFEFPEEDFDITGAVVNGDLGTMTAEADITLDGDYITFDYSLFEGEEEVDGGTLTVELE